ncbi:MAG TPA: hypothetical protein VLB67_04585 [Acidimicrobiia bacterium]|nr:hypothetical protein [Acidimicrobiia bacterium]
MTGTRRGERFGRAIGLALYLLVGFFYLASGLLVPTWPWLVILVAVGTAGFVLALRLSVDRWWVALAAPFAAALFWFLYVNLGDALLGWTA